METFLAIVTAIGAVGAIVAAAVAIVQAKDARAAEKRALEAQKASEDAAIESAALAAKATAAFEENAAQTKRLADLKAKELAVPDWGPVRHVTGSLHAFANTSHRTIIVDSFVVQPADGADYIEIEPHPNNAYLDGDSVDFYLSDRARAHVRKLQVFYRFDGDPEGGLREFIIPL